MAALFTSVEPVIVRPPLFQITPPYRPELAWNASSFRVMLPKFRIGPSSLGLWKSANVRPVTEAVTFCWTVNARKLAPASL